jgi:hypothetical protein
MRSRTRRRISVNRLIVEPSPRQYAAGYQEFDDLDALVGAWSRAEAAGFAKVIAPFAEIDSLGSPPERGRKKTGNPRA